VKPSLYASADVFVSLANSVQESFGLTLLEAAAAARPIIATDWDGYKNLIVHGENGLLVETRLEPPQPLDCVTAGIENFIDVHGRLAGRVKIDPHEVAALLLRVLSDRECAERLSVGAQELARRHAWPEVIPQVEKYWQTMGSQGQDMAYSRGHSRWFLFDHDVVFAHYPTRRPPLAAEAAGDAAAQADASGNR
jgi:glycosyltransferase involved in cell wall biosynthesis